MFGKKRLKDSADPEKSEPNITLSAETKLERVNSYATLQPRETTATVRVHDEFGRELFVPIETWRTQMLPGVLQKNFDKPDILYGLIVDALGLRLAADVVPATAHLYATDTNAERGAVLYSIVLMDIGKPEIAERILSTYLGVNGCSGVVLTNLAKALAALHREVEADDALWRGLQADPNQENGLGWYAVMQKERHGEAAWGEAMRRVAELPGAWRPQLWLARLALDGGDKVRAMALYYEALGRVGRPVPTEVLQQISGDLGKQGLLAEAVTLTRPAYDAKFHGLAVGNNLIKAELDLGHETEARALVEELYLQQRRDWAENLNYWENEIRKKELAEAPALAQLRLNIYSFNGPVWLSEENVARSLFPPRSPRRAKVLFTGSTIITDASRSAGPEMPDAAGRMSRAMPFFLAENAFMRLSVDTATLIPWVEDGGFAVLGATWSDVTATEHARGRGAAAVAAVHLRLVGGEMTIGLRVLTVPQDADEETMPLIELSVPLFWADVSQTVLRLCEAVVQTLGKHFGEQGAFPAPLSYVLPDAANLWSYLLRLEQLLAVRCAKIEVQGRRFLTGERDILRGQFDLVLRTPLSLPARLILLETLRGLQKVKPEIAAEFRSQAELLATRYPLPDERMNELLKSELRGVYGS